MNKTKSTSNRRPRIAGIGKAAEQLGVNRVTLWRAIHGKWDLPKLMKRYQALKEAA